VAPTYQSIWDKRKEGTKKRYFACRQYHNKRRSICNPNLIDADWLEKAIFERLIQALQTDSIIEQIT